MYRKNILKGPEQPWFEDEMHKKRAKIKVATSSKFSDPNKKKDYSTMADWEGEGNRGLNRLSKMMSLDNIIRTTIWRTN